MPNSSFSLQYLEVIHRHHKVRFAPFSSQLLRSSATPQRTPYASNTFFREDVTFDCSPLLGARHYARNASGSASLAVPIAWEAALPGVGGGNEFESIVGPGFNSTCQFPQITAGGLEDSWQHGKVGLTGLTASAGRNGCCTSQDLAGVYQDKLGFISSTLNDSEVTFRVTNNEITSQVLGALIVGLYPNVTEHGAIVEVRQRLRCSMCPRSARPRRAPATTASSPSTPVRSPTSSEATIRAATPTGRSI